MAFSVHGVEINDADEKIESLSMPPWWG
jgi:hypothetical protein